MHITETYECGQTQQVGGGSFGTGRLLLRYSPTLSPFADGYRRILQRLACQYEYQGILSTLLPARASEQGNVTGSVRIYIFIQWLLW